MSLRGRMASSAMYGSAVKTAKSVAQTKTGARALSLSRRKGVRVGAGIGLGLLGANAMLAPKKPRSSGGSGYMPPRSSGGYA